MSAESVAFVNDVVMWATLLGHVAIVILVLALCNVAPFTKIRSFVSANGISLSFMIVLGATLGSLYYSNIANFAPCVLCWYQRVSVFPQVLLFGLAFKRKTRDIIPYTTALSWVGLCISLYQVILERLPSVAVFCDPAGISESCATIYVKGFNYITIPVMSLTVFALLLLIAGFMRGKASEPSLDVSR